MKKTLEHYNHYNPHEPPLNLKKRLPKKEFIIIFLATLFYSKLKNKYFAIRSKNKQKSVSRCIFTSRSDSWRAVTFKGSFPADLS